MKAGKAPSTTSTLISQKEGSANGKRGFRRHIQFRHAGDAAGGVEGGDGGAASRLAALDDAQGALESFYASFPVVPLLSVAHAKVGRAPPHRGLCFFQYIFMCSYRAVDVSCAGRWTISVVY